MKYLNLESTFHRLVGTKTRSDLDRRIIKWEELGMHDAIVSFVKDIN